jgi:hypothetical protein
MRQEVFVSALAVIGAFTLFSWGDDLLFGPPNRPPVEVQSLLNDNKMSESCHQEIRDSVQRQAASR